MKQSAVGGVLLWRQRVFRFLLGGCFALQGGPGLSERVGIRHEGGDLSEEEDGPVLGPVVRSVRQHVFRQETAGDPV